MIGHILFNITTTFATIIMITTFTTVTIIFLIVITTAINAIECE